jgi:hypothetical protein
VSSFARSLLVQRVPEIDGMGFLEDGTPNESEVVVARCLLSAALVRRAWHEALGYADANVRLRDDLPLEPRDLRSAALVPSRLVPALEQLSLALGAIRESRGSYDSGIVQTLTRLKTRLANTVEGRAPGISGHDGASLLEISWLLLITPIGLYPGWHELMTAVTLQSYAEVPSVSARLSPGLANPRPTVESLHHAAELAARLSSLRGATNASWQRSQRVEGGEPAVDPRTDFYDAVADVLAAQLGLMAPYGLPNPTAFVTSMDLELEMALVRKGQRFTVLVPYHFLFAPGKRQPHRAMLFWLAATVQPAPDTEPGSEFDLADLTLSWRDAPESLTDVDGIVVVRLVGSPLMPTAPGLGPVVDPETGAPFPGETLLSCIADKASAAAGGSQPKIFNERFPSQALVPAFLLDEYSGLHQMIASAQGSLPSNLAQPDPSMYRYWLAVGVPLEDPLVRLLLASQLDSAPAADRPLVDHHGVMVNRDMSTSEADVLAWEGMAAVGARFDAVSPDLWHYAAHLRVPEPKGEDTREWAEDVPITVPAAVASFNFMEDDCSVGGGA